MRTEELHSKKSIISSWYAMIEKSEKYIYVISGSSQIQNQKIDKLIDQMGLFSDKLEILEKKNT